MLSPLALLLLLPVGGLITLLYLLKQKRRDVRVPSLLLWEQVLSEAATASPFQKLRVDPLLILQLLAVLLLCGALARPFVWRDAVGGRTVVLVLDASASMNAVDVPGGRLNAAVAEARKQVSAKAASDNFAVVVAGAAPRILSPLTTSKAGLFAALARVMPSDTPAPPREALLLAGSLAQSRPDACVVLITDGVFRQDEVSLGGATLSVVTVGRRGANAGITAFDVREATDGDGSEAFVSVLNADTAKRTTTLTLSADNALVDARELIIPAGETRSVVIPLATGDVPPAAELLTARIEGADDLPADDTAFAAHPRRDAVRVLLVAGGDDPFLERALSLAPRAVVRRVAPGVFTPKDVAGSDITVWDSDIAPPATLPAGRYLFFGAVPLGAIAVASTTGATVDTPPVLDWDRASPVLRFTNLSGVRVRTARKIIPAAWASVLIESRSTPLLVGGERGASRVLYAAFRPTQSDLPLRVAFPVFVSNAVSYLSAGVANTDARVVRPGDALAFPPGASVSGDTSRVGRYTVTQNGVKTTLAVSLSSAGESQTAPDPSPQIVVTNAADAGDGAKPRRAPREWGMWLAAPLLLLLVGEWWAWSRRKR